MRAYASLVAFLCAGLLALILTNPVHAADSQARMLRIRVVNSEGRAVGGVPLRLVGKGRQSVLATTPTEDWMKGKWTFESDEKGVAIIPFEDKNGAADGKPAAGPGEYYLLANAGDKGAVVSPMILNPEELAETADNEEPGPDDVIILGAKQVSRDIRLLPWIQFHGKVTDEEGKPAPKVTVTVSHDLGAETHTGRGNEAFGASAESGKDGSYVLKSVYPDTVTVELGDAHWVRTRLRGRGDGWQIDRVQPQDGETDIEMDFVVSKKPAWTISGKVTGPDGKPVAGAEVSVGLSYHPTPSSHADYHSFAKGVTDAQGKYSIPLKSPYIRGVSIAAKGFAEYSRWYSEEAEGLPAHPGTYDFSLKAGDAGGSGESGDEGGM